MRHVVSTHEVADLWAKQSQSDARNQCRNFYFEGDTIYSYGNHFPIARHVTNGSHKCILLTTRTYSSTTSGHVADVRCTIMRLCPGVPVFHVESIQTRYGELSGHDDNFADYQERIDALADKAKKATKYARGYLNELRGLMTEANAYAKFFGLSKKIKWDYAVLAIECAKRTARISANAEKRAQIKRERSDIRPVPCGKWTPGERAMVNNVLGISDSYSDTGEDSDQGYTDHMTMAVFTS